MNFTLHCDPQPIFDQGFLDEIKAVAQSAMAIRFFQITQNNFGMSGEDRPETWPALTKSYADVYHQGSRIPKLELTGDLKESIEMDNSNMEASYVFTNNPYAWEHQYGNEETHLPPASILSNHSRWRSDRIHNSAMPWIYGECGWSAILSPVPF